MFVSIKAGIKSILFSLIPLCAIVAVGEIGLRIANFRYSDMPLEVRNKPLSYAEEIASATQARLPTLWQGRRLIKDKFQHWVPQDSFEQHHEIDKAPAVVRIATLGCSCTQGCAYTAHNYPSLMQEILNGVPGAKYEILNAGVGGYSSYQGLQRLKYSVLNYHPDIVTFFFGWNDHWFSYVSDKQLHIKRDWEVSLINFLEQFRIYQFYHFLIATLRDALSLSGKKTPVFRVSPKDYESNLNEMIDLSIKHQAKPVLITAPSELSGFQAQRHFPFPKETLIQVHAQYNQIVKSVAQQRSVPLIDLAQMMEIYLTSNPAPSTPLFTDGVHFTPPGCALAAEMIVEKMRELGLL